MNPSDTTATQRLAITQRLNVLRPDSIRSRILAFAVLAALLPSLATAWFSYLENGRSLAAKASEELLSVSTQAAREVDLWFKERRYDLRVFASSYEVTDNLERIQQGGAAARAGQSLRHLTEYLKSVHERFVVYDELLAVDSRGRVVASNRDSQDAAAPVPEWRAGLRGDELVLGRPYWNAEAGRPEVLAGVPVGVGGRASLGAIVGRVNLQLLARTLSRFAPGESGEIYLIGGDGSVLFGSRGGSADLMALGYPQDEIQSRLANESGPIEYVNVLGQEVLGSARRVPGQDWVVVAEIPLGEAFSALRHLRNVMLLIVAGMLVVAGALGYALGLFIVRPLDRLTRGAAKVAGGDLGVDLPVAAGGEVGYLTEVFNDMVARLRASRTELERLSVTDFLTGLNNRRRMMEALEKEVLRSRRLKHPFTVLIADIDNFKQYNDAHGHPAGDEVLKRVAAALADSIRDVDFVARYGGEEFFVMMPELEASAAAEQAERIRERIAQEKFTGAAVTLSIGMAEFPAHGDSGESLIAAADAALYEAKHAGRNRSAVARPPSAARVSGR